MLRSLKVSRLIGWGIAGSIALVLLLAALI